VQTDASITNVAGVRSLRMPHLRAALSGPRGAARCECELDEARRMETGGVAHAGGGLGAACSSCMCRRGA
jgi:hypothetical protein